MWSQEVTPVYRQYTEKDGLTSNWIMDLSQDQAGFLWIATNYGLANFDGKDFHLKQPTRHPRFQKIFSGKGDGFLYSISNEIFLVDRSNIVLHPLWEEIQKIAGGSTFHSVHEDTLGHIWFSIAQYHPNDSLDNLSSLYQVKSDTIIKHSLKEDPEAVRLGPRSYWKQIGDIPLYTGKNSDPEFDPSMKVIKQGLTYDQDLFPYDIKRMIRLQDGSYLATSGNHLIHFDDSVVYFYGAHILETKILDLYEDLKGSIWLSTLDGAICIEQKDFSNIKSYKHYLTDYSITSILQTSDSSYWFGTRNAGLFHVKSLDISWVRWAEKEKRKNLISGLRVNENRPWFVTNDGHLYWLDSSMHVHQHPLPKSEKGYALYKFGDQLITSYRYLVSKEKWSRIKPLQGEGKGIKVGFYFSYVVSQNDSIFWFISLRHGFFGVNINQQKIFFDSRKHGFTSRIHGLSISYEGVPWFIHDGSLWQIKDTIIQRPYDQYPRLGHLDSTSTFIDVLFSDSGTIFLHSLEHGVTILHDQFIQNLRPNEDFEATRDWSIMINSEQDLLICSRNNFHYFVLTNDQTSFVRTHSLYLQSYFPTFNFRSFNLHNGKFWCGTDKGILHFDPDPLVADAQSFPPTYIEYLESADSLYTSPHQLRLSHKENNFFISFRTVAFQNRERLLYRYRIPGIDPTWQFSKENTIRYTNLSPGKYVFEVECSNEDGVFQDQPSRFQFEITPHVTQTLWFLLLMIFLAMIPLGFLVIGIARIISRQNNNKRLLTELKYQALISQISPHFIFNAMNSISFLIKNQQPQIANRYLSRFGGLLRGVLEHADHTFVPLEEEIVHLQSYMELEQLQMKDQLEIEFYVDPALETSELYVPPMLFQPAIENAIKHGISPKGRGEILVHFLEAEDRIFVAIRDDGIGRDAARHVQHRYITNKKRSIGVQNTMERIQTIRHMYGISIEMQIEDLTDNGQSIGTQVEFNFPKLTHIPTTTSQHFLSRILAF